MNLGNHGRRQKERTYAPDGGFIPGGHLDGERESLTLTRTQVQPCMDCRFCWKKKCVIKDGMQDIYQKLERI